MKLATTLLISPILFVSTSYATMVVESDSLFSPNPEKISFSKDYRKTVEAAFPAYDRVALQTKLEGIAKRYRKRKYATKLRNLRDIERLFGIEATKHSPNATSFRSKNISYAVNLNTGRIYYYKNMSSVANLSTSEAEKFLPDIVAQHKDLFSRVGISENQILSSKSHFIKMQSSPFSGVKDLEESEAKVVSVMTYALRSFEGIMVEGSWAKVTSKNPKDIESLNMQWPDFEIPPQLLDFTIKDKDTLKKLIVDRVSSLAKGAPADVKIAVAFQPIWLAKTLYHVPALSVDVIMGNSDANTVFFEELTKQGVRISEDIKDDQPIK